MVPIIHVWGGVTAGVMYYFWEGLSGALLSIAANGTLSP